MKARWLKEGYRMKIGRFYIGNLYPVAIGVGVICFFLSGWLSDLKWQKKYDDLHDYFLSEYDSAYQSGEKWGYWKGFNEGHIFVYDTLWIDSMIVWRKFNLSFMPDTTPYFINVVLNPQPIEKDTALERAYKDGYREGELLMRHNQGFQAAIDNADRKGKP